MENKNKLSENTCPFDVGITECETQKNDGELSKKLQNCVNKMEKQLEIEKPKELPKIKIRKDASELIVITKAKDFVKYVIQASGKIPKQYRFSFATKIQNLCMDLIEYLLRANDIAVKPKDIEGLNLRHEYQTKALTNVKLIEYFVTLAVEEGAMLLKQFNNIAKLGTETGVLISKWKESDKRRFIG